MGGGWSSAKCETTTDASAWHSRFTSRKSTRPETPKRVSILSSNAWRCWLFSRTSVSMASSRCSNASRRSSASDLPAPQPCEWRTFTSTRMMQSAANKPSMTTTAKLSPRAMVRSWMGRGGAAGATWKFSGWTAPKSRGEAKRVGRRRSETAEGARARARALRAGDRGARTAFCALRLCRLCKGELGLCLLQALVRCRCCADAFARVTTLLQMRFCAARDFAVPQGRFDQSHQR
mmetsp:Transcript_27820/g.83440  ORF Transcript_27820/g.83440 Transcript_27820/m.83440 type:complete len:234 (-) Transcript_27820:1065-1766(-)